MDKKLKVVSIGGGTGQSILLRSLASLDIDITAIVAMADDGGSTGILRSKAHAPAPGDIRKCLLALSQKGDSLIARAFAHRMESVDNHALGNLILFSMYEETDDFTKAIEECSRVLDVKGRVLPSTLDDITLYGQTREGKIIAGQAATSHGSCTMEKVWIEPEAHAFGPCVDAILEADVILVGPGSLFTSIMPNFCLPEILHAVQESQALKVFVCPKSDSQGETWGMRASEYVEALCDMGLTDVFDIGIFHKKTMTFPQGINPVWKDQLAGSEITPPSKDFLEGTPIFPAFKPVKVDGDELERIKALGMTPLTYDFDTEGHPYQHDVVKLREVLRGILQCRLPER